MVLKYICICIVLFVLGEIQFTDSTPVREKHVLNKIPIVIPKSKNGNQKERVAQDTRSSARKPAAGDVDDEQIFIPGKARSGKTESGKGRNYDGDDDGQIYKQEKKTRSGKSHSRSTGREGDAADNDDKADQMHEEADETNLMKGPEDKIETQNEEADETNLMKGPEDKIETQNEEADATNLMKGPEVKIETQNEEADETNLMKGPEDKIETQNEEADETNLMKGPEDKIETQNEEADATNLMKGPETPEDKKETQNEEGGEMVFMKAPMVKKDGDDSEEQNHNKKGKKNDENTKADNYALKDKSFKKYHVEKISYTQENIASSWPLGIIPYHFDTSSFDHILASRVREAMDFLESASCVQFKAVVVKPALNFTWIHITNPDQQRECSHHVSHKRNGEITLILGLDCLKRRDILHSLLHAMGFKDEVAHAHRDQYIRIMWENIQPKYQKLFSVISEDNQVLVEYDPMSIMHFHDRAFSKNGHATIVPMMPGLQIQPSEKLSQLDKMKLRLAFGHECNRRAVDDLLDTCKNVLHDELESKEKDTPQAMKAIPVMEDDAGAQPLKAIQIKKDDEGEEEKKDGEEELKNDKEGEEAKVDDDGEGAKKDEECPGGVCNLLAMPLSPHLDSDTNEEVGGTEVEPTPAGDAEPTEAADGETPEAAEAGAEPTEAEAMIL